MSELKDYFVGDYGQTLKYVERMQKGALSNFPPLIITCAITGGMHGKEANMNLPESVEEQVVSARDAYNAGASMIHIHRRSAANHSIVSQSTEEYLEVNARIREACPDVIINNTAMGGRLLGILGDGLSDRLTAAIPAAPEVASIDLFSYYQKSTKPARKPPLTGRPEPVTTVGGYLMKYEDAMESMDLCDKYGVKYEFEVQGINDLKLLHRLVKTRNVERPWVQLLVNGQGTFPVPEVMMAFADLLPRDAQLGIIGLGVPQIPMLTMGIILGHHVRVGMEDNTYYGKGELLKSNAQVVERIVRIAKELGRPIATPAQAREMMGLSAAPRQYIYPAK